MNIRDLKYFVAVAKLGHFGQAAEQCYVSQPTLSGQIKKLEASLGIQLFERTNRRVVLTESGKQILRSARKILAEVDHIKELAQSSRNPLAGKFRLGAIPTLSPYLFPQLVGRVVEGLPKLRLVLVEEKTESLVSQLKQGLLDAALLALPLEEGFLQCAPLFDDAFYLAVAPSHPLAKKTSVRQDSLREQKLLLLDEGHCLRDQALAVCSLHNIAEEQDYKATSLETLRLMVKAGTGITFMPQIAMNEKESGIRYVPLTDPVPSRTIGIAWRKTTTRKPVLDALKTYLQRDTSLLSGAQS